MVIASNETYLCRHLIFSVLPPIIASSSHFFPSRSGMKSFQLSVTETRSFQKRSGCGEQRTWNCFSSVLVALVSKIPVFLLQSYHRPFSLCPSDHSCSAFNVILIPVPLWQHHRSLSVCVEYLLRPFVLVCCPIVKHSLHKLSFLYVHFISSALKFLSGAPKCLL